jgi:hypothetical protein
MMPIERIIRVFDLLYKRYTAEQIGAALKEYRLREGFWKPEEVKPKTKKEPNVKTTPTNQ